MVDHWKECGSYPVLCPNKCTDVTFERKTLDQHLNDECPLIIIRCRICESEMPRQMLPVHLQQHSATNKTKNIYLEYHHPCLCEDVFECTALGDQDSLDSQLKSEIALKCMLEQQIEVDKGRCEQIRQEIHELQQNYECELLQLKSDLQIKQQEVAECHEIICRKENEITNMKERRDRALAEERVAFEKQITFLNEQYLQKMKQYQQKKTDSKAEKDKYELELEKTRHKYEMEIKNLELELERKKRELAERESKRYKRHEQILMLQADIALDKERKEKERLKEQHIQEIEKLKRDKALLERQLQSFIPRPGQPERKPNEDYM